MSYDLYFTGERVPKTDFDAYSRGRQFYELNGDQAWYSNDDTGVYFSFEYSGEDADEDLELDSLAAFTRTTIALTILHLRLSLNLPLL